MKAESPILSHPFMVDRDGDNDDDKKTETETMAETGIKDQDSTANNAVYYRRYHQDHPSRSRANQSLLLPGSKIKIIEPGVMPAQSTGTGNE
ncbi:hypothetical protein GMORB2_6606 [Geosmithia morbida]|uniref:Uncharacterized protein n=1 Tax=Geosmithia morbida TaxID=1094350 RepID=A0A9P4YWP8_9HYPO|nr:uncharacterized protein GMORB2_6606 [Geosmithia morbida]KAF4123058.1 hypothetical protein GMORB2_6606 [Geosmithia morbida]